MDLTKVFYDLAKAQGPGDYSKIFQQDAISSLAVPAAITESGIKYLQAMQLKKLYDKKIEAEFFKTGKQALVKLQSEGLNSTIFNSFYDRLAGTTSQFVAANSAGDEKAKIKVEAETLSIINTMAKFKSDLVAMATLLEDNNFAGTATGTQMKEVLNAIMKQDAAYSDDVEVFWDETGLNFNVTTTTGIVNVNAKDLLGHFKQKPNASEGLLTGDAGEAEATAATGNPWDDDKIDLQSSEIVRTAWESNEFKAFCTEKLFGSENSYADQLFDHPDIKNATFTSWGITNYGSQSGHDALGVGDGQFGQYIIEDIGEGDDIYGTSKSFIPATLDLADVTGDHVINRSDFEGEVGRDNKDKLINALTDPDHPAFNEELAKKLLRSHVDSLLHEQTQKGNVKYHTAQNKKIFKDMTGKIRAMELERPGEEVKGKINAINTGEEFWDWGAKGGRGRFWPPVPGKIDTWVNNSKADIGKEFTREQVLAEQLKIDSAWWGTSVMTRAKFTTNPFEEYSAVGGQPKATGRREDAPKEFIDAI